MGTCKCSCGLCGKPMQRYQTLVLTNEFAHSLGQYPEVQELIAKHKHFVLCAHCIKKLIGKPIDKSMLKFETAKQFWRTNNFLYFAATSLEEGDFLKVYKACLLKEDKKHCLPISKDSLPIAEGKFDKVKALQRLAQVL